MTINPGPTLMYSIMSTMQGSPRMVFDRFSTRTVSSARLVPMAIFECVDSR